MATDEAQICNKALIRIGVKTYIDDLATDQSEEAEACNILYADTRDSLLKQFNWPFATRRAVLAQLTNEKRGGWAYCFQFPADCLKARYIWPDGLSQVLYTPVQPSALLGIWTNPRTPRVDQRVPFAVEKQTYSEAMMILCDYSTPTLVYTSKTSDVAQFSALFTDALSWMLATDLAMALTLQPDRYKLAKEEATAALKLCQAESLNEAQEDVPPDSEIISARL
jgi:hypothetical protein